MMLDDRYDDLIEDDDYDYYSDNDYYPAYLELTEEPDSDFEEGCNSLVLKIDSMREFYDLSATERMILDLIEELIELL